MIDKKVPNAMVVRIPSFRAVTVGEKSWEDMFKSGGYMYQLWQYEHLYENVIFDCFDFLLLKNDKAEWICAVKNDVTNEDISPFELLNFKGGLYAMAVCIDEDEESMTKVENKVYQWIEESNFELDKRRSIMFNMPYLYENGRDILYKEIEKGLGYKQMQRYFPIKLKESIEGNKTNQ